MARILAEIILSGARVVGRALGKAISDEILASQQAAKARQPASAKTAFKGTSDSNDGDSLFGITIQESKMILNIKDIKDSELLEKNYKHLFDVNNKNVGGSIYLQSKVFRAKERIDYELKRPPNDSPREEIAN